MKRNLLIGAFVFVVFSVCIFSSMGYYYLTYRNELMQNAVVKSGQMTMGMFVQSLELDIISLEHKMILDVALQGVNHNDGPQLAAIHQRNPIVDQLFFSHGRQAEAEKNNDRKQTIQDWLIEKVDTEDAQATSVPLTLRHFSGRFKGLLIQGGFVQLSPSPREVVRYLIFTLDLKYIRNTFLQERTEKADRSLIEISIREKTPKQNVDLQIDRGRLSVDVPFVQILPFWSITAGIDTSGMGKRARMEFIAYSGIIALMLLLIVVSIYFIWVQMQQERRLSLVKSQMISHVSHELKTPLSLIRMYTETLMLGRVVDFAKTRQYYRIILSECDRLHLFINNTLDFSSIEKGMKEYNFNLGDLVKVVQDIITSYGYFLKEHGFSFQADLDSTIPPFYFDKMAMMQIVGNLLDNAMKFSPEEKDIHLKLKKKGKNVVLEIADHGVGIQIKELQTIFQPYHRLSTRFRGSGIGLSLVKHATLAHHGTIHVHSTEGDGSTFVVTLPLTMDHSDV